MTILQIFYYIADLDYGIIQMTLRQCRLTAFKHLKLLSMPEVIHIKMDKFYLDSSLTHLSIYKNNYTQSDNMLMM
jgi:hypothetical protein